MDMRLVPYEGSIAPADLQVWLQEQEKTAIKGSNQENFSLSSEVMVKRYGFNDSPFIGQGTARMDRWGIQFRGNLDGEEVELFVDHEILPGLTGDFGDYFYLPTCDHGALAFYPHQGKSVIEWKFTQEYFHSRSVEGKS